MITSSYRDEWETVFDREIFLGERKFLYNMAIATFSQKIYESVLEKYPHKEIAHLGSPNGRKPIWLLDIDGKEIVFYMSGIGACQAGNDLIEMQWQTGIMKFVIFGSAGSLDNEVTAGKYIIPTEAYRDEGMSYHYAPPSDYIDIRSSEILKAKFKKFGLPYVCGKVWTTDAPYRETKSAIDERKADGCIAVEMELAGVQAVCDFHGIELYSFLVAGDVLGGEKCDCEGLTGANHSIDNFDVALKLAEEMERY